jgi:4'-phosphopantetheinyl transferase
MTEIVFWPPATPGIQLSSNEVHIWRARLDLDSAIPDYHSTFLSNAEQKRAASFMFAKDRDHFTLARIILRQLLGGYLGEPPQGVIIEILKHGKPALTGAAKIPSLRFNLSHSHGLALFAFCLAHEVGVDLEKIRPEVALEGIESNFSQREKKELAALPLVFRPEGFFLAWTRKEAYVKAHGEGLEASLKGFDVSLTPEKPAELTSSDKEHWSLYSLHPGKEFVGALVVEGKEHRLRFCEWQKSSLFQSL